MSTPNTPPSTSRLRAAGVLLLLVAVGAGIWFIARPKRTPDPADQPIATSGPGANITQRQLEAVAADKTPNSALALAAKFIAADIEAYTKLPPEQRKAELDRRIDEAERIRKAATTAPGENLTPGSTVITKTVTTDDSTTKPVTTTVRRSGNAADMEKAMAEELSPALRADLARYIADMRQRRKERGLPEAGGGFTIKLGTPKP